MRGRALASDSPIDVFARLFPRHIHRAEYFEKLIRDEEIWIRLVELLACRFAELLLLALLFFAAFAAGSSPTHQLVEVTIPRWRADFSDWSSEQMPCNSRIEG